MGGGGPDQGGAVAGQPWDLLEVRAAARAVRAGRFGAVGAAGAMCGGMGGSRAGASRADWGRAVGGGSAEHSRTDQLKRRRRLQKLVGRKDDERVIRSTSY